MKTIEEEIVEKMLLLERLINNYEFNHNNCSEAFEKYKDIIDTIHLGSRQYEIIHLIINKRCCSVSDLSKTLDLSNASLSLIISKMVDNNLIVKNYETTNDSRVVILELTELGCENYNILKEIYCKQLDDFINVLNDEELKILYKAIYSLYDALSGFSIIPVTKENTIDELVEIIFENLFILKIPFEKFFREVRNALKDTLTLTKKEITILMLLLKSKVNTPSEIATVLNSSESTISTQLKSLVKKGHLSKEKCKKDSRKTFFTITELGLKTIIDEFALLQGEFIKSIDNFNSDDKIKILNGLKDLQILFEILSKNY